MTVTFARKAVLATLVAAALAVSGCSTNQAIDTTVGVAAGATKVVAKGAVGAGKLAYSGGKSVVGAFNN